MRGAFFQLERNSLQNEGQVLFRYLPVWFKDRGDVNHPIYVTIKPYAVDFFFHGKDEKGLHVVNTCIVSLPLSMNLAVKDNLSFILQNLYNDTYIICSEDDKKALETEGLCHVSDQRDQRITYWNLEVFGPEYNKGKELSLRKLLLDFIFDLEHSSVFDASPYYEVAEVHLKENFCFSAIASKASYFYLRKMYQSFKGEEGESIRGAEHLYALQLKDAEKQWLNTVRDPRAGKLFGSGHNWFESVEKEYRKVMFRSRQNQWDRALWRQRLEGKKGKEEKPTCKVVFWCKRKSSSDLEDENIRILSETARWFLRRYAIRDGLRALFQYKKRWFWKLLLGFISLFLAVMSLSFLDQALPASWGATIFVNIILSVLLLPLLLLLIFRKVAIILTAFGILLPRLIMAAASAWLVFVTTEELWKVSFDTRIQLGDLLPTLLLLLPVIIFMAIEIHNIDAEIKGRDIVSRIASVLFIGFIYSLIIGVFFIHFNCQKMLIRSGYLLEALQDVANNDEFEIPEAWERAASNSNADRLPDVQIFNDLKNVKYSFLFHGNELRLKYDVSILNGYSVHLFPGMLLYRALFAVFIGIFVQLIFEDKPITEPL